MNCFGIVLSAELTLANDLYPGAHDPVPFRDLRLFCSRKRDELRQVDETWQAGNIIAHARFA